MNSYRTLKLLSTLSWLFVLYVQGAEAQDAGRTYSLECPFGQSGDFDTGETVCKGFHFDDGISDISAGVAMASESGFDDNEWLFEDGLRIVYQNAEIAADTGRIVFDDNALVEFELTGSPAQLTVYIVENDLEVTGTASSISYRTQDQTLRLGGESEREVELIIGDNQDQITSCNLLFNLRDNSYEAGTADNCGMSAQFTVPDGNSGNDDPDIP